MSSKFIINGCWWDLKTVPSDSPFLKDCTGKQNVGTTDPVNHTIYISEDIDGEFRKTVIRHEIGHALIFSYGLDGDIREVCERRYWIYAEEFLCNFLANYAEEGLKLAEGLAS